VNHDELVETLHGALRERTTAEWMEIFEAEGVNAGPINTYAEVVANEQVRALGIFRKLVSAEHGEQTVVDMPVTFDGVVEHPPPGDSPRLGEHNDSVLASLGYSAEELAALAERGVLAQA
jgi:crotonobetainyl-CoA:carnitine CoA-transferase CaiB-like acyl-CoA transferase